MKALEDISFSTSKHKTSEKEKNKSIERLLNNLEAHSQPHIIEPINQMAAQVGTFQT